MQLNSLVSEIKQVGIQRSQKLSKLGILTIEDLITHFPREYDDRSNVKTISQLTLGEENTFLAAVMKPGENIRIHQSSFTRILLSDGTGSIYAVWYNQPYRKDSLTVGMKYLFTGRVQKKYNKLEVTSPDCEMLEKTGGGRILPIYPSVSGLSQKIFRSILSQVLPQLKEQLTDFLPEWIRKEYCLAEKSFAVQNIHFPSSDESFFQARRRLVFEEFFMLQVSLLHLKNLLQTNQTGIIFEHPEVCQRIMDSFPFALTNAQKEVILEIQRDIVSNKVMNRLVQGDVGSGKTAVAMVVSYWAIQNGYQAVLMAPTEVLANQHFASFLDIFAPLGIHTTLLTGTLGAKDKRQALLDISTGVSQMVIGTHAVIQKSVVFYKLGLVITDEQHRFGVRQRGALSLKGETPHVLVMTATPIPRTLALILYGDLDISIIHELPPGRQEIKTFAVTPAYRQRVYGFIKEHIQKGLQAYIICPMIEESDKLEAQAVISYTEKLQTEDFQDYAVACIHGKMKPAEKQEVMASFADGNIHVLVATTVIEVGVNVPNAVIMLVENMERFGLAQLHQLRGRVGRGSEQSYCILVSEAKTAVAKRRMKAMEKSSDGFVISELDLKLRGPGEFFGTRQHGLPELKIANIYKDMELLKEAQQAASSLLREDAWLTMPKHALLKLKLEEIARAERLQI